jgi:hypothetical protein
MPSTSKAQHGLMGMVLAYKRGKSLDTFPSGVRKRIKRMASDMSEEQLKDYTSTKASDLPEHSKKRPSRAMRKARAS